MAEEYNSQGDNAPERTSKSIRGYQIVIILLVVVLGVWAFIYFRQVKSLKAEAKAEKAILEENINDLIVDLDNLKVDNDSISYNLGVERQRADSLMERLQNERNINRATIRKYEKELGTMRDIMRHYVKQIDSLNQLNRSLTQENVAFRQQVNDERIRAQAAEERASELSNRVKVGAIVRARDIVLTALNSNDRVVPRASRAERLRVDFILTANDLATPGERNVYVRITGPDGYVLASDISSLFDYEGDKLTYSAVREIDYQNKDLEVGLYYNGAGITSGTYRVEVYMDGYMIGTTEAYLK